MSDFLKEIEERTKRLVAEQKTKVPLSELRAQNSGKSVPRFESALRQTGQLRVIAELKQASPSAGIIREENDFTTRVRAYARGGAAAMSVLTERDFFKGSPEILKLARVHTDLPLLRKDFIIDPYQIEESRAWGADAILLIVAMLADAQLAEFIQTTRALGMDALVEVHDQAEAERALKVGASLIGINHRNLRTLTVDSSTGEALLPLIVGESRTAVVESGIREVDQIKLFKHLGAQAVLMGETFMRSDDPESVVRTFVEAGMR